MTTPSAKPLRLLSLTLIVVTIAVGVIGSAIWLYARTTGEMGWVAVAKSYGTFGTPLIMIGLVGILVVEHLRNRQT